MVLTLAGCVTTPIKSEQKANIHNIALVALMGNELEFTKVGFTVFNNDSFIRDSTSWNIDAEIENLTAQKLEKSSPNIKVVSVPFDRSELFKIYKSADSWGEYASIERITPELKSRLAQNPVDAVLLVHKQRGQDPVAMTSIYLQGYGVYYRKMPLVDPLMKPYALFVLFYSMVKRLSLLPVIPFVEFQLSSVKHKYRGMKKIKTNLSDELLLGFRQAINKVIDVNMDTGLKEMGL